MRRRSSEEEAGEAMRETDMAEEETKRQDIVQV